MTALPCVCGYKAVKTVRPERLHGKWITWCPEYSCYLRGRPCRTKTQSIREWNTMVTALKNLEDAE